jgi:hypothetical protein
MTGRCVDNPRNGIIGCGATYGGERQHSVARVSWSTRPDGRAHITASLGTIDSLWQTRKGETASEMASPLSRGLTLGSDGVWRVPVPDADRSRLIALRRQTTP